MKVGFLVEFQAPPGQPSLKFVGPRSCPAGADARSPPGEFLHLVLLGHLVPVPDFRLEPLSNGRSDFRHSGRSDY